MSLAMALYNHHGIVMSADKMCTVTYPNNNGDLVTINKPPTEQKLFIIEDKYGLSYTGTSSIGGVPLSALLEEYFFQNIIKELNPNDWLLKLAVYFQSLLPEKGNIIFIMCGYYNNKQFVITTNTSNPKITDVAGNPRILYSGEQQFVDILINSKIINYEYQKFTMQDSVDFLCFINRTIAGMMYWGQYLPTVSYDCDILAIYPNKSHWVQRDPLHKTHWGI